MTATQEILDLIDSRLRALREEIEALGAARAALDESDSAAGERSMNGGGEARPPAARTPRRGRRQRRVRVTVTADTLERLLSQTAGLSTSELAERAGGDRDRILTVLRELEAAGRIRRAGQRRGTRWHAITDEERIERRAAELAARSRASAA
jgi:hypothetical protein